MGAGKRRGRGLIKRVSECVCERGRGILKKGGDREREREREGGLKRYRDIHAGIQTDRQMRVCS